MLSIPPNKLKNHTLLTALEWLKIIALDITPFEGRVLGAAIAEYFPNYRTQSLEWRKTINACLHLLDANKFNSYYDHGHHRSLAAKAIISLKQRLAKPIADNRAMVIDSYLNNRPAEVIAINRSHIRFIAQSCHYSAIPLKLYLLINIRTIHARNYARINQQITGQIFGCTARQVRRAQEDLVKLGVIIKHDISPANKVFHGVLLSIVK